MDEKKILAGARDKSDDLWKLLEEGYLEEVLVLKDLGLNLHDMIQNGYVPTKREVAIAIMASLSYGELMKRKYERAAFEKAMTSIERKTVHITLKKPEKGGYAKIGRRIAKAIEMTEINTRRLSKYGILSGSVMPAKIPKPSDFPEIDSISEDGRVD
jgi:hypothetical protein